MWQLKLKSRGGVLSPNVGGKGLKKLKSRDQNLKKSKAKDQLFEDKPCRGQGHNFSKLWSANFVLFLSAQVYFVKFLMIVQKQHLLKIMNVILKFYTLAAIMLINLHSVGISW